MYYLTVNVSFFRWFGMRIDMISSFFIAAFAFASIPLATS